jgi:hypothetical protein
LYATLDRQKFEQNYLALFAELPVVVQAPSSTIVDHVKPGSARFVHIDASHLYEHVAVDVDSAQKMLIPDGVVAFDDYRSTHTPGVAAAVWEAVFTKGLRPICVTPQKLYGTFGDPVPHQRRLEAWLAGEGRFFWESQALAGRRLVRMRPKQAPKRAEVPAADAKTLAAKVGSLETSVAKLKSENERLRSRKTLRQRIPRKVRSLVARVRK